MRQYQLIAFKEGNCVRHVAQGDQAIIEDLLWKGWTVYRPDTNQVASGIVEGCVGWVEVVNSPMPYVHNEKSNTVG